MGQVLNLNVSQEKVHMIMLFSETISDYVFCLNNMTWVKKIQL